MFNAITIVALFALVIWSKELGIFNTVRDLQLRDIDGYGLDGSCMVPVKTRIFHRRVVNKLIILVLNLGVNKGVFLYAV